MTPSMHIRRSIYVVFLFIGIGAASPQVFVPPIQASRDDVIRWLESNDPRMIAWGAHFAAANQDQEALPYIQRLAEEWMPLPVPHNENGTKGRTDEQKDRVKEMSCVLDALIQMHGTVAPDAIGRLALDFKGQALTIFGTMPEPQRKALAISIYASRQPGAEYAHPVRDSLAFENALSDALMNHQALPSFPLLPGFDDIEEQRTAGDLIHFAAAILANDPPPGFAASLLNESTVELEVSVGGKDPTADWGPGATCGDSLYKAPPKDWPEPFVYVVEESWPSTSNGKEKVIVPGVPALTTRRAAMPSSCSTMGTFTTFERIKLLNEMTGASVPIRLGWTKWEYAEIAYTDDATYRAGVQRAVAQREQAFQVTAAALLAKGFLTPAEVASARPTVNIMVRDARETKEPELPVVPLTGIKMGTVTSVAP